MTFARLESLSKHIPDRTDVEATVKPRAKPETDLPKDRAARAVIADPNVATQPQTPSLDSKGIKILIFSHLMDNNRLDSYIALAEARAGNLNAALAKIDHMSTQYMKAVTLKYVAETVVERLKRKRE